MTTYLYAGVGTYFLIVGRNFTHFFLGFIANLLSNIIACCWNLCSNPLLRLLMIVFVCLFFQHHIIVGTLIDLISVLHLELEKLREEYIDA